LHWHSLRESDSCYEARVPFNIWSYGERLQVDIQDDGTVSVLSRCSWRLQCFDWGKNRTNVSAFFSQLKIELLAKRAGIT
jgi:hypothetical protein